jgi:hypothetical protein
MASRVLSILWPRRVQKSRGGNLRCCNAVRPQCRSDPQPVCPRPCPAVSGGSSNIRRQPSRMVPGQPQYNHVLEGGLISSTRGRPAGAPEEHAVCKVCVWAGARRQNKRSGRVSCVVCRTVPTGCRRAETKRS